jgi:RNA polymerase sigma factor (sigma-70 family)
MKTRDGNKSGNWPDVQPKMSSPSLSTTADGAAIDDNRAALNAFMARHYEHLARRLTWHLGCADLARDSLHEAWLHLAGKDAFATVDNPAAYIYRVACNAATDCLRADRPWQQAGEAAFEHLIDERPGPGDIAEARSDLAAVARAMQRLPRLHSAVLVALRIDEVPRQEVANRYGLSLRSVDTALRKGLECCGKATAFGA